MSDDARVRDVSRRDLLALIGTVAGSSMMYQAMTVLGFAAASPYAGPIRLDGDPKGTSVLVLGAGLAGLVAALELRKAGYRVVVLEVGDRVGGRSRTLRGGDVHLESDGVEQVCSFEKGLYLNPGPWRVPYHHRAVLDYCRRFNVALEPFVQINHNAYVHASRAFDGRPKRFREIHADFTGHVAELLSKAVDADALDAAVSTEDKAILLEALKFWGALDRNYVYAAGVEASERRGWLRGPGGGVDAVPVPSQPVGLNDILESGLWRYLSTGSAYDFQPTLFQPSGGMDGIAKALSQEVADVIRLRSRVVAVRQDAGSVTVTYEDTRGGSPLSATADWCLCTLPLPVLKDIAPMVGAGMSDAIAAIRYAAAVKIGLQMKRRFWEEDEAIYGGITYTDLPISQIGYPSSGYASSGKGVLVGAYAWGAAASVLTRLPPEDRVKKALDDGGRIHPHYAESFETGISVSWQQVPEARGCYSLWSEALRDRYYAAMSSIDGRILLAGEHVSYLPGWQEGAILSALDAIARLHRRVVAE